MLYFKILSLITGTLITLISLLAITFTGTYQKWMEVTLAGSRPRWVVVVNAVVLGVVVATWIQLFSVLNSYAAVITAILSLSLIKMFFIFFCYEKFRAFALQFLSRDKTTFRLFCMPSFLIGVLLLILGGLG